MQLPIAIIAFHMIGDINKAQAAAEWDKAVVKQASAVNAK